MNDGYMGSGKVIRSAIAKHGITNFTKVILEQFDTSVAMYAREKEVVTEEFLSRSDVYNLRRGGTGGFDYINTHNLRMQNSDLNAARLRKLKDPQFKQHWRDQIKNGRKTGSRTLRDYSVSKSFLNCNHTTQAKRIIGAANKIHQAGNKNSQFGSKWITNGISNKKIQKFDLMPVGWKHGRTM